MLRAWSRHRAVPGLALAAAGVLMATALHEALPAVPTLTLAVVLGVAAAHLPKVRVFVRTSARAGLAVAAKRLMRAGVVLLGLQLSVTDVAGLGLPTAGMVVCVVLATLVGTYWLGRRLGLPGDVPVLVAAGYAICGASAIGAVGQVTRSEEDDVAGAVALVTLCGTLAIAVLPVLHTALGMTATQFGRWAGASVHDVGQVVATAQTAGPLALREAVLVKLMRVVLLAPLTAGTALALRRSGRAWAIAGEKRPPALPLFVAGFLAMMVLRSTQLLGTEVLDCAAAVQHFVLASALFGLGAAVNLSTLGGASGRRMLLLGAASWVVVAGLSYAGVLLTT
ncbi:MULTISPECIES: YeiH family protein [Streptomyces]|uniref:YeiH family protein n=1 Tax=Streptomyces TaxID=1883 RepID=UPI0023DD5192|nr:putative sulfate exporter family transporter [Streptomyces sp. FXJ1.172]WEP00947.1 putative sulfate exporter family transporter [Streptomyces sp. FXJ1.172]